MTTTFPARVVAELEALLAEAKKAKREIDATSEVCVDRLMPKESDNRGMLSEARYHTTCTRFDRAAVTLARIEQGLICIRRIYVQP